MPKFNVIVGNLGIVYETDSRRAANVAFHTHRRFILRNEGRGTDYVCIISDTGELLAEWNHDVANAIFVDTVTVRDPQTKKPIKLEVWKSPHTDNYFAIEEDALDHDQPLGHSIVIISDPYDPTKQLRMLGCLIPRESPPETNRQVRRVRVRQEHHEPDVQMPDV